MTTFESCGGRSQRVRCSVCGRVGWNTNGRGWQAICKRGHAPCPKCGRQMSVLKDGSPRSHPRCPA
jgi:hypothetical protein